MQRNSLELQKYLSICKDPQYDKDNRNIEYAKGSIGYRLCEIARNQLEDFTSPKPFIVYQWKGKNNYGEGIYGFWHPYAYCLTEYVAHNIAQCLFDKHPEKKYLVLKYFHGVKEAVNQRERMTFHQFFGVHEILGFYGTTLPLEACWTPELDTLRLFQNRNRDQFPCAPPT